VLRVEHDQRGCFNLSAGSTYYQRFGYLDSAELQTAPGFAGRLEGIWINDRHGPGCSSVVQQRPLSSSRVCPGVARDIRCRWSDEGCGLSSLEGFIPGMTNSAPLAKRGRRLQRRLLAPDEREPRSLTVAGWSIPGGDAPGHPLPSRLSALDRGRCTPRLTARVFPGRCLDRSGSSPPPAPETGGVRQLSIDASWQSFPPLAALLLLDVGTGTPASERPTTPLRGAMSGDANSSPGTLSTGG